MASGGWNGGDGNNFSPSIRSGNDWGRRRHVGSKPQRRSPYFPLRTRHPSRGFLARSRTCSKGTDTGRTQRIGLAPNPDTCIAAKRHLYSIPSNASYLEDAFRNFHDRVNVEVDGFLTRRIVPEGFEEHRDLRVPEVSDLLSVKFHRWKPSPRGGGAKVLSFSALTMHPPARS
jgi:hypothetical protein